MVTHPKISYNWFLSTPLSEFTKCAKFWFIGFERNSNTIGMFVAELCSATKFRALKQETDYFRFVLLIKHDCVGGGVWLGGWSFGCYNGWSGIWLSGQGGCCVGVLEVSCYVHVKIGWWVLDMRIVKWVVNGGWLCYCIGGWVDVWFGCWVGRWVDDVQYDQIKSLDV